MTGPSSLRGFTLIELALVVIIAGLLIGGILVGRELIHNAELRGNISQLTEYRKAVELFSEKYQSLPGDLANAPATLSASAAGSGNGDGIIQWNTEGYLAWNHLSLAQMISGRFTGTATGGQSVIGVNVPQMKWPVNSGVSFLYVASAAGSPLYWWGTQSRGNVLVWGSPTTGSITGTAALSPNDASDIDRKMDDGKPDFGVIQSNNNTACTTAAVSPASYAAGATPNLCLLIIQLPKSS